MIYEGLHQARATKVNVYTYGPQQKTKIVITFTTEDKESVNWTGFPESEKALPQVQEVLTKIGFTGESISDLLSENSFNAELLHDIYVIHEEYVASDKSLKKTAKVLSVDKRNAERTDLSADKMAIRLFDRKGVLPKGGTPPNLSVKSVNKNAFMREDYKPEVNQIYTTDTIPF